MRPGNNPRSQPSEKTPRGHAAASRLLLVERESAGGWPNREGGVDGESAGGWRRHSSSTATRCARSRRRQTWRWLEEERADHDARRWGKRGRLHLRRSSLRLRPSSFPYSPSHACSCSWGLASRDWAIVVVRGEAFLPPPLPNPAFLDALVFIDWVERCVSRGAWKSGRWCMKFVSGKRLVARETGQTVMRDGDWASPHFIPLLIRLVHSNWEAWKRPPLYLFPVYTSNFLFYFRIWKV
jgi:hypothetical protein